MNSGYLRDMFSNDQLVNYYNDITFKFGLNQSELLMFKKYITFDDTIMDLGCGAGRTTIGLFQNGYRNICGVDISEKMIEKARENSKSLNLNIDYCVADAINLPYRKNSFSCVFFSFNGFMLLPSYENREKALIEIKRVLINNGFYIFTTPYLDNKLDKPFWINRLKKLSLTHDEEKLGDILLDDMGVNNIFIHIPLIEEINKMLIFNDFKIVETIPRCQICLEDDFIENELDDNLFWVAKKNEK
jgi:SAM-dependent methyltransferase